MAQQLTAWTVLFQRTRFNSEHPFFLWATPSVSDLVTDTSLPKHSLSLSLRPVSYSRIRMNYGSSQTLLQTLTRSLIWTLI